MKAVGRPRTVTEVGSSVRKRMPRKETEVMRQMRASYLSMGRGRSYRAIAEQYGYSPDWIAGIARAFNWIEDAQKRDESINNTFVDEHQGEINEAQKLLFASMLHDIREEALKRGIRINESGIIEKLNMEGTNSAITELNSHLASDIGLRSRRGYKDINEMINAMRKVVHEWNQVATTSANQRTGNPQFQGAKIDNMNVCLIIEK